MAVRARRLYGPFVINPVDTWVLAYTVPSGRTLVIKSLMFNTFGTGVQCFAGIDRSDGSGVGITYGVYAAAGQGEAFGFGWVLNPLQSLWVYARTAATVWAYGAGSLLAGAPL